MVQVGAVKIGEGQPKICVSVTEDDRKSVIAAADILVQKSIDIIEWRMDYYKDIEEWEKVEDTLHRLKMSLGQKPLLVTFRSLAEGGSRALEWPVYRDLLLRAAKSGYADMIDVEVFQGISYDEALEDAQERCKEMQELIRELRKSVVVIGSYHDFENTPSREEMEGRLRVMSEWGADILKLAVMPKSRRDAIELMEVTMEAWEQLDRPLITMAMGGLGVITRLAGEFFGSAMTFGCVGQSSAPGQIAVDRLADTLELIHQCYR